jgi:hypothetical protein
MLDTLIAKIKAEVQQEDILKILRKRLGSLPQSLEDKIKNIHSVEKLEEILLAILDVTSIGEVENIINQ